MANPFAFKANPGVDTAKGTRGKVAEKKFREMLKALNGEFSRFAFFRFPDARAARGALAAAPCDFLIQVPQGPIYTEVKETEFDDRIPAGKIKQLPDLKKMTLAGGRACVVILHTNTGLWRCVPAKELEPRSTGSWDLSRYPTFKTCRDAFMARYPMSKYKEQQDAEI